MKKSLLILLGFQAVLLHGMDNNTQIGQQENRIQIDIDWNALKQAMIKERTISAQLPMHVEQQAQKRAHEFSIQLQKSLESDFYMDLDASCGGSNQDMTTKSLDDSDKSLMRILCVSKNKENLILRNSQMPMATVRFGNISISFPARKLTIS